MRPKSEEFRQVSQQPGPDGTIAEPPADRTGQSAPADLTRQGIFSGGSTGHDRGSEGQENGRPDEADTAAELSAGKEDSQTKGTKREEPIEPAEEKEDLSSVLSERIAEIEEGGKQRPAEQTQRPAADAGTLDSDTIEIMRTIVRDPAFNLDHLTSLYHDAVNAVDKNGNPDPQAPIDAILWAVSLGIKAGQGRIVGAASSQIRQNMSQEQLLSAAHQQIYSAAPALAERAKQSPIVQDVISSVAHHLITDINRASREKHGAKARIYKDAEEFILDKHQNGDVNAIMKLTELIGTRAERELGLKPEKKKEPAPGSQAGSQRPARVAERGGGRSQTQGEGEQITEAERLRMNVFDHTGRTR